MATHLAKGEPGRPGTITPQGRPELLIEAWKKTVDVQQHFNDMAMRVRALGVTLVLGAVAAAGFTLEKQVAIDVGGVELAAAGLVVVGALIAWLSFYFMERWWYHLFLKGAVDNGIALEGALAANIPENQLGKLISARSKVKFLGLTLDSTSRLNIYYAVVALLLLGLGAILLFGQVVIPPAEE